MSGLHFVPMVLLLSEQVEGLTHTPPDPNYDAPDGEIVDNTPDFNYQFEIDRQFQAFPKARKRF